MTSEPNNLARPLLAGGSPATASPLPLLPRPPALPPSASMGDVLLKPLTQSQLRARRTLRRFGVAVLSRLRAERTHDPGPPSLAAAEAYMRYFLPKTDDGKLLPITCTEQEFAAHVGSGVAMYMNFVKMTGWMFFIATIFALPQFVANLGGSELKLEWPLNNPDCHSSGGIIGLVSTVLQGLGYIFYSCLLGNVSFSETQGIPHLASELLLSMMFCVRATAAAAAAAA